MDLFEWALKVSRKQLKSSSYRAYASLWGGFNRRLVDMGTEPGKEARAQLAQAIAQAGDYGTQKRVHSLVQWVYETLSDHGLPLADFTHELDGLYMPDSRAQHVGLNPAELARLEAAACTHVRGWKGVRLAAVVSLLAHTGMKQHELIGLERQSLAWAENGSVRVTVGKKSAQRTLELPASCAVRLRNWLEAYPAGADVNWLFVADTEGRQMDASTLWRQLKRLCERELEGRALGQFGTGLIHASVAKAMLQEGKTATQLREFLGHQQESSTAELLERVDVPGLRKGKPAGS